MKNTSLVSMTGFAESTGSHEGLRWRWEAKSVNGRSLDIRLRTPPGFDSLEPPARMLATERFRRGSLQVSLTVEQQEAARGLKVDPAALAAAIKLAREVAAETGLAPARIDGLLALKGVIVQEETVVLDPLKRAQRDAAILKSLADALDAAAGLVDQVAESPHTDATREAWQAVLETLRTAHQAYDGRLVRPAHRAARLGRFGRPRNRPGRRATCRGNRCHSSPVRVRVTARSRHHRC